jgi:hypothetical protein
MTFFKTMLPGMFRSGPALAALALFPAVATACPDCALKNSGGIIEPQTVTAKMALSDNTLLMIGMVIGVMAVMIWSMVRTLRDLEAQRALPSATTRP